MLKLDVYNKTKHILFTRVANYQMLVDLIYRFKSKGWRVVKNPSSSVSQGKYLVSNANTVLVLNYNLRRCV